MNITRLEPWSLMNRLQRNYEHLPRQRYRSTPDGDAQWHPAVDIIEEQDRFVLRADVPGVRADDIEINMDKNVLTVSGSRELDKATENATEKEVARRIERSSGRFERRFNLPETAQAEEISARTANGILEVVIPKKAELQPRKISVQAA